MEFKTKAALTEWANHQTMPEIAAYYNELPGVKPIKKFESRDVAVTRIWAVATKPLSAPPRAQEQNLIGYRQDLKSQLLLSSVYSFPA